MLLKKALGSDRLYCSMVGASVMNPLPHAIPGYLFAWPVPDSRKNAPGLMVSTACGELRTLLRSQQRDRLTLNTIDALHFLQLLQVVKILAPQWMGRLIKGCPDISSNLALTSLVDLVGTPSRELVSMSKALKGHCILPAGVGYPRPESLIIWQSGRRTFMVGPYRSGKGGYRIPLRSTLASHS